MRQEPPALRGRDFPMACITLTYAGWYAAAHRRWVALVLGAGLLLLLAGATLATGLHGLVVVAVGVLVGVVGRRSS